MSADAEVVLREFTFEEIDSGSKSAQTYHEGETSDPMVKDVRQRGTYNWLQLSPDDLPTIVVPGCPRRVTPMASRRQLRKSTEERHVDENRARAPLHPMEPLFCAVSVCDQLSQEYGLMAVSHVQPLRFQDFNFVTDRNNLTKLYGFCSGVQNGMRVIADKGCELFSFRDYDQIRIDIERIGHMIVLIRCEDRLIVPADEIRGGYGQDFTYAMTEDQGNERFKGTFRNIVSYRFGKHNMLVRCNVDAVRPLAEEDLFALLDVPFTDVQKFAMTDYVQYMMLGELWNQWKVVELTTRYAAKSFPSFMWPHVYFSGYEQLVLGWYQKDGILVGPNMPKVFQRDNVYVEYLKQYGDATPSLRRLAFLLDELQKFVLEQEETRFTLLISKDRSSVVQIVPGMNEHGAVSDKCMAFLMD